MAAYQVYLRGKDGHQEEVSDGPIYDLVAALTERVITALQTKKAISCFKELSEMWKLEHGAECNVERSTEHFQKLLKGGITDPNLWPILTVDFRMKQSVYAKYDSPDEKENIPRIEKHHISLNGQRFVMLSEDRKAENPEWYPRWLEMFISYCHEIAHLYISYLSLTHEGNLSCSSPVDTSSGIKDEEAGDFLERRIFGGLYSRGKDMSKRGYNFMPGVPVFKLMRSRDCGIPLRKLLNLANRPPGEAYSCSDLELELYPYQIPEDPNTMSEILNRSEEEKNYYKFNRWWEEYKAHFGIEFAQNLGAEYHKDFVYDVADCLKLQ